MIELFIVTETELETRTDFPVIALAAFLSKEQADQFAKAKEDASGKDGISWEVERIPLFLRTDDSTASSRMEAVREAIALVTGARDLLKIAKTNQTLKRLRLVISSIKGALRNASSQAFREAHPELYPPKARNCADLIPAAVAALAKDKH